MFHCIIFLEFCSLCTEGTYQDLEGQDQCKPCPPGYYSSTSKDRCNPCEAGTYSVGDGSGACIGCSSDTECPCQIESTCFSTDLCVNTGSGNFQCLGCPVGFTGNGITCSDIDEVCTVILWYCNGYTYFFVDFYPGTNHLTLSGREASFFCWARIFFMWNTNQIFFLGMTKTSRWKLN